MTIASLKSQQVNVFIVGWSINQFSEDEDADKALDTLPINRSLRVLKLFCGNGNSEGKITSLTSSMINDQLITFISLSMHKKKKNLNFLHNHQHSSIIINDQLSSSTPLMQISRKTIKMIIDH
jgi:hypothetical protein